MLQEPRAWEEEHSEEEEGPRMPGGGGRGGAECPPPGQSSGGPSWALLGQTRGSELCCKVGVLRGGPHAVRARGPGLGPVGTGTGGVPHVHSSLQYLSNTPGLPEGASPPPAGTGSTRGHSPTPKADGLDAKEPVSLGSDLLRLSPLCVFAPGGRGVENGRLARRPWGGAAGALSGRAGCSMGRSRRG